MLDHFTGVLGLLIGTIGIILAVRSDRKFQATEQARKRVERKFKQYMAAQEFQKLAADGLGVMHEVTTGAWPSVTAIANRIGADLLRTRGGHTPLLTMLERDKLDVAVAEFQQFILSLPVGQSQLTAQQTQAMISRCLTLAHTASELSGRLGVESMSESGEEK